MNSDIEAIGTAVEGMAVGRAFEKQDGENITDPKDKGRACLNCKTPLIGTHCHKCGQSAHIHRSLSAFWHDILHGVLHFDGKFWRTLPLLAWHPGKLTRRYIHGERARFISPIALFLFSIFMMFAIFSYVGSPNFSGENPENSTNTAAETDTPKDWRTQIRTDLQKAEDDVAEIEAALAGDDLDTQQREKLTQQLDDKKAEINGLSFATGQGVKYPDTLDEKGNIIGAQGQTGWKALDDWLQKAAEKANSNPDLLLYKLQSNGYKFAWLLIPLSIPCVWLVTIGKAGHRFYDHAVFTTYSIAFMSLLFITASLSVKLDLWQGLIIPAAIIYAPFHLYRQLRYAYDFSRLGAIIRLSLLLIGIIFVLVLFFLILITLGLLG